MSNSTVHDAWNNLMLTHAIYLPLKMRTREILEIMLRHRTEMSNNLDCRDY